MKVIGIIKKFNTATQEGVIRANGLNYPFFACKKIFKKAYSKRMVHYNISTEFTLHGDYPYKLVDISALEV